MALHFDRDEFAARMDRLQEAMAADKLDAMLLFAQESMYWLTGYDSFGYVFFQCMVVTKERRVALVARAPDLRQARQTSIVEEIVVWADRAGVDPAKALKDHLFEMDLLGARLGVETETHGLTARNGKRLEEQLRSFATVVEASALVPRLISVKSPAEIAVVRRAAALADDAWRAGVALAAPGADEGAIHAAMQGALLSGGGDPPANPFIIGSGKDALLVRYHSGRRTLDADDQLTLEFAGVYRHYHAAMMDTVVVGTPKPRHEAMWHALADALVAAHGAMREGNTFGDVFDAHVRVLQDHGMGSLRLNACGYSLGAAFAPSWMQWPMFYHDNSAAIVPNMVLFAHMIVLDVEQATAMSLGRTYLTTEGEAEPLSAIAPAFVRR
ncbi:M24 family metallopeptidase [Acuticoccus sp.]|uniref:M24 family metallopeptidase n=1 Tax=Acuticoccus sp. TaxID=1904378 RepID=UPI003B518E82